MKKVSVDCDLATGISKNCLLESCLKYRENTVVSIYLVLQKKCNKKQMIIMRHCRSTQQTHKCSASASRSLPRTKEKTRSNLSSPMGGAYKKEDVIPLWKKTCWHNGVRFPSMPDTFPVKIFYRPSQRMLSLTPETQEIALSFGRMLLRGHPRAASDQNFRKNFMKDWVSMVHDMPHNHNDSAGKLHTVESWDWERFVKAYERHLAQKQEKVDRVTPKSEIAPAKVFIDGSEYEMGRSVVDRPGIFVGRGNHPLNGRIRRRITAGDVDLNLSKDARIPSVPPDGRPPSTWRSVVHDPLLSWLARWTDPLTHEAKYAYLGDSAHLKQQHEKSKFHMASSLQHILPSVVQSLDVGMRSSERKKMQAATCASLILAFGIRAGSKEGGGKQESEEEKHGVVGAASLRASNVHVLSRHRLRLTFTGKDHVQHDSTRKVSRVLHKNMHLLLVKCRKQSENPRVFDSVSTEDVNEYLGTLLPGLTSKVMRTRNASSLMNERIEALDGYIRKCGCQGETRRACKTVKNLVESAYLEVAWMLNHKKGGTMLYSHGAKDVAEREGDPERSHFAKHCAVLWKATEEKMCNDADLLDIAARVKKSASALGLSPQTSKVNYVDPRIIFSFLKRHELPFNMVYTPRQLTKFGWAHSVPASFRWPSVQH